VTQSLRAAARRGGDHVTPRVTVAPACDLAGLAYTRVVIAPHDYVLQPVPTVPIKLRGQASFAELIEVFCDNHGVALVGSRDPELGPYGRCIRVASADVDAYCSRGYRPLSAREQDAVFTSPEDFADATD
jgi:hypothetical protein